MKILHLFSDWKWTGPADPALSLASHLSARGHEVWFASGKPPVSFTDSVGVRAATSGVRVLEGLSLRKHFSLVHNAADVWKLAHLMRDAAFDVVHAHRDQDHLIAGAARSLSGASPVLVRTNHTAVPFNPWSPRKRLLVRAWTDLLVEISSAALNADSEGFGLPESRLRRVEAPVDLARFVRRADRAAARASMGIPGDQMVFGIVARVQRRRRFDKLFEAFRLALARKPDMRLVVVGRGTHFDEVAAQPVERAGMTDKVIMAGYRTADYPDVLASFDAKIFLVPGTDGSCRAVREAMACGIPVISSRRGMLPEIVVEGTGLLVDDEPEPLCEGMLRLATDAQLRERLGRGARESALKRFDPAGHAAEVEKAYEEALARTNRTMTLVSVAGRPETGAHVAAETEPDFGDLLKDTGEWPAVPAGRVAPATASVPAVEPARGGPDVSVVIVNWNGGRFLRECLDSARESADSLGIETVMVDNASNDESVAMVRGLYPEVRVVENKENRGFGAANNQAFGLCRGRHVLLLNTDARLRKGTLRALVSLLDLTPTAGAVTPRLSGADGRPQNAFDNFPHLSTELLNKSLLRLLLPGSFPHKRSQPGAPFEVESALGACLLVRGEALSKVGGFDEDYFFFLEETDLCLRMRRAGFSIFCHPLVEAVHLGGGSKASARPDAWIEYYRSLYTFFRKNRPAWEYRALRAGRFVKVFANLAGSALLLLASMGLHRDSVKRFPVYLKLAWWHINLCPGGMGLKGMAR